MIGSSSQNNLSVWVNNKYNVLDEANCKKQFYSRYQEYAAYIKPTMLWMCNMQLPHHISIIFLSRMQPFYNVGWLQSFEHAHIITQFTTRQQCLFLISKYRILFIPIVQHSNNCIVFGIQRFRMLSQHAHGTFQRA